MISFIVPAFNEAKNIEPTVHSILRVGKETGLETFEIVAVDDGSTDGTGQVLDGLAAKVRQLKVLHHQTNRGLGSSIRSGVAAATHPQFMVIPGDNDVPPALIRLMLGFRDNADMILTAPLNKEVRSLGRNFLSTCYQLIHMVTFNVFVNYINGPGIWPTELARRSRLRSARFSIISELNVKLLRSGCTFAEVPGYFQGGQQARRTVTLRNLIEVARSFVVIVYEVHVRYRRQFSKRPRRVLIEFDEHIARLDDATRGRQGAVAPPRAATAPSRADE